MDLNTSLCSILSIMAFCLFASPAQDCLKSEYQPGSFHEEPAKSCRMDPACTSAIAPGTAAFHAPNGIN
ncbi:MAG TPA: hypothetical protein PLQ93_01360 [Bacteroidia bacterium]|nr:hypothetical protein [Bacteroidia bacterium]